MYIDEAHAEDRWPVRSGRFMPGDEPVCINAPQTIRERFEYAQRYHRIFKWPKDSSRMFIDTIDNYWGEALSAWPMRAYLFFHKQLVVASEPEGADVGITAFVDEVRDWVHNT